ncbi:MAG: hypothetical protein H8E62_00700 [Planctomycetes bacterium]|nr:hypothetical protein [Planctomycetota bacterium]
MKKMVILSILIVLSTFSLCQAEVRYTITNLGTLGGSRSEATGINDSGQVIGSSRIAGDAETHAFLYDNGVMTDLGTLGGSTSGASSINNNGQIVGASTNGEYSAIGFQMQLETPQLMSPDDRH